MLTTHSPLTAAQVCPVSPRPQAPCINGVHNVSPSHLPALHLCLTLPGNIIKNCVCLYRTSNTTSTSRPAGPQRSALRPRVADSVREDARRSWAPPLHFTKARASQAARLWCLGRGGGSGPVPRGCAQPSHWALNHAADRSSPHGQRPSPQTSAAYGKVPRARLSAFP